MGMKLDCAPLIGLLIALRALRGPRLATSSTPLAPTAHTVTLGMDPPLAMAIGAPVKRGTGVAELATPISTGIVWLPNAPYVHPVVLQLLMLVQKGTDDVASGCWNQEKPPLLVAMMMPLELALAEILGAAPDATARGEGPPGRLRS